MRGAIAADGTKVTAHESDGSLHDVGIIGGGIAGLATAYELQQRGLTARVIEAGPRPGGVIRTERFDGWVIDAGPDSILVQKPAAIELCRELGIAERLVPTQPPRTAYVVRGGTLHAIAEGSFLGFPITASAIVRTPLFSPAGKLRMALEPFVPAGRQEGDESIAAFVARRFGREVVEYLAEPLLAGIHAGDVDRLSIRALFPRLVEAERRSGSVLRARRSLRAVPSSEGAFVSLPGGTGELVEALSSALRPGTIVCDCPVTDVRRSDGYHIVSGGRAWHVRALVLAVPAYVAGTLLRSIDPTLAGLCDAVPYASTATAFFGYHRDQVAHPLRGTGFVVPRRENLALLAGTWVTSKWPGRAPSDHVLLRGFLGGGRDPGRLEAPDTELLETARRELTQLLGLTGAPVMSRLYRWTRQSPQYEVGHLERVAEIERRLVALPGLFVTGSGFRAIGIPDCVGDGRATARSVADLLNQPARDAGALLANRG